MSKIAIVLPSLVAGGTERVAVELANHAVNNSVEVVLIVMYNKPVYYKLNDKVKLIEPPKGIRKRLGAYLYVPYLIYFIRSNIKKTNPDAVFSMGYILFTIISMLDLKNRLIISWRGSPLRSRFGKNFLLNKLYNLLHQLFSTRVNGIIAQTKESIKYRKVKYNCKTIVIPNFVRKLDIDSSENKGKYVLNVGRCISDKAQHFLLKAFANADNKGWKLLIVGDGPLKSELENLAVKLNIGDKVEFLGYKKNVDYYYSKASVFAFTSINEGFPNALLEAMASRIAVISFDCMAGPSDIIVDGVNGFLVDVGDLEEYSKKLSVLMKDSALREKFQDNATSVNKTHNLSHIAGRYLDFILT
ncbi:MAG: glycosyltransferase family 4 protein [Balneolales bacterium]|nr:glycosyltransferase family 4 protein [Balneolales bacterium]